MKVLTLKNENNTLEHVNLDAFLVAEAINYGFADNLSEKSRLEGVLERHIEHSGDTDLEIVEIKDDACHVLCIIDKFNFDFSEYFGNVDKSGETIK